MRKISTTVLILAMISLKAAAQSVGPNTPTNYATTGGTGAGWGNLSGVLVVDNNPAYVDLAQYPTCNLQMCYYSNTAIFKGFGFSVPGNATIVGVKVGAMERVSSPTGGIHDSVLVLSLNDSAMGLNYADTSNWTDVPVINYYGGVTDMWGTTLTPVDINDPSFGMQFLLTNSSYDQPASVDYLTMTVYYQAGVGIEHQTSSPWKINFYDSRLLINADASILNNGGIVEVRNILGKLFYNKPFNSNPGSIDLSIDASSWNNGVYLISVKTNSGVDLKRKAVLMK